MRSRASFIDEVNRHNHMMKSMGPIIRATHAASSFSILKLVQLGSIDLAKFYDPANRVDWDRLREVTHLCTRFLET